jgi:hypothetical protein
MTLPVDYHYGSALDPLGSTKGESAFHGAPVTGGESPMNSLGARTDSMLDCLERLDATADSPAPRAPSDQWLDPLPPVFARHPEEGGDEGVGEEEVDDDEDLGDEDFDDEDEDFDDEEFDDEDDDEDDIDELEEIDDIDIDEEDEDFDEDEDLDEIDDDEDEDLDDI